MKKEQTVPVKDRLLMFEKQRQKIASKRTTPKENLPAEKKRKRKITDEDCEVKEENENDDIHNSENGFPFGDDYQRSSCKKESKENNRYLQGESRRRRGRKNWS
ncbi:uncharacterized protein [Spinacia oleracea]|uniref:Uncharacterized protein n=1 Tax=Spinacia oleracea TaxID=3562 RepID=A0ABM3RRH3_SPIOL|nr:uncharacterized protein LOC110806236 [Spinacia oleracea]